MPALMGIVEISLQNDMNKLSTASNNVSNVATNGYKREIMMTAPFEYYLTDNGVNNIPTLKIVETDLQVRTVDMAQSNLTPTSSPLDLAIEGQGFFVIHTDKGVSYIRSGSFKIDNEGRLSTKDGHVLAGESGDIRISVSTPNITPNGEVWDGDQLAGKLMIVEISPDDRNALTKDADGNFDAKNINFYQSDNSKVRQGNLETSNVESSKEMISTIETLRHFELSQKLIHMQQEMFKSSIDALGTF